MSRDTTQCPRQESNRDLGITIYPLSQLPDYARLYLCHNMFGQ